jgi:pimeloyl-ACP methyl ester carboxylesterase
MRTILLLLVCVSIAHAAPEKMLPLPSPDASVGTRILELTAPPDSAFPKGRPITVQLWFPTAAKGAGARYLADPGLDRALVANAYYGIDSTTLEAWSRLTTHAVLDARPARGRYPLFTFSVGLGVIRANYTTLAEELAGRSAIVAMVESPLAGLMVRDGHVVMDTTADLERADVHRARVQAWAEDVRFALDHLGEFAALVDRERIVAVGHSSGGLVAIEAAERDERIARAVDLDGGLTTPEGDPLADFVAKGVTKPALLLLSRPLYSDADLAKRGMTRAQWLERAGKGGAAFDSLKTRSSGEVTVVRLAGTGHFSFSDAPFVMPSAITRFGGTPIEATRGLAAIADAIFAFANGIPQAAFARYPEFQK